LKYILHREERPVSEQKRALEGTGGKTPREDTDQPQSRDDQEASGSIEVGAAKPFEQEVWSASNSSSGLVGYFQGIVEQQTEAPLRDRQRLIEQLVEMSPGLLYLYDVIEQRNIYINRRSLEFLGYSPETILEMGSDFMTQTMHPDDLAQMSAHIAHLRTLPAGSFASFEYRMRHADGNWRWFSSNDTVFCWTATGQIHQILGTAQDITKRKQEEQRKAAQYAVTCALAEAHTLADAAPTILQSLCENLEWQVGIVWRVDPGSNVLRYVNSWQTSTVNVQAFIETNQQLTFAPGVGLPGRIWVSRQPIWVAELGEEPNLPRAMIATRSGLQAGFGFPILLGSEMLGVIECFSDRVQTLDADLIQMMTAIGSQIGQFMNRKQVEEALENNLAQLEAVINSMTEGLVIADPQGNILMFNPAALAMHGFTSMEEIRQPLHSFTDLFDMRELDGQLIALKNWPLSRVLAGETFSGKRVRLHRKDINRHWVVQYGGTAVRNKTGNTILALITVNDITCQYESDEALRTSAERLSLALAAAKMGNWSWDAATDLVTFSEQAAEIFGIPAGPYMTWTEMQNLLDAKDRDRARLAVEQSIAEHKSYNIEYRIIRPDHELCWVAVRGQPQYDLMGNPLGLIGVVQDVTDHKRSEAEIATLNRDLQNRVNELETLFEVIPIGILIASDSEFKHVRANPAFAQLLGIEKDGNASYTSLNKSSGTAYKIFRNGKELAPEETPLRYAAIHGVEVERTEVDILRKHDNALFNLYGYAAPLTDDQGRIRGSVGAFLDITNRKKAEAEREQLLERERIAREAAEGANRIKDDFLAVLSHELRTPLNPILGWTRLLRTHKFDEQAVERALETIERNAKLQTELIEDLLDVSRILQGKMVLNVKPVGLVSVVEAALETVRLAADAKRISLRFEIADSELHQTHPHSARSQALEQPNRPQPASSNPEFQVSGDPGRLQQIVWNLLSNAIKFTPPGGVVEIQLEMVEGSGRWAVGKRESTGLPVTYHSTPIVQIQVKDTGKGIRSEFVPHVFEYFRQEDGKTTRSYGGLGLGLAIVRHLTELHGGTVKAESPGEGLGATFTVRLPLLKAETEGRTERPHPASLLPSVSHLLDGLRILVVDDEADMRELLNMTLQKYGAEVAISSSATEALTILQQFHPDLLISDIGMEDIDGYMLIQQVRALSSEQGGQVLAIALTAYAAQVDRQRALAAGFQVHIPKPVVPEVLVQEILKLMGNRVKA
jgi:PAS domain S-box-containing protein